MAATGSLSVQGNINNLPTGSQNFGPVTILANNAVGENFIQTLSVGNNTVTLPAGATAAVVVGPQGTQPAPNPAYGGVITLKGIATDTGIALSAQYPTVIPFANTSISNSFVLNATVATSVQIWTL